MELPEYVTKQEVRRVCAALGLEDWTQLTTPKVSASDAEIVRRTVGGEALEIPLETFHQALEVELEHGIVYPDSNVTNNHPVLTGRIVAAHLKESLEYYQRLEVAELEGDLLKALRAGDAAKAARVHRRLAAARRRLAEAEVVGYESLDV